MQTIKSLLAAAIFSLAWPAMAQQTTIAISPTTAARQTDGGYVLGDLQLTPGQWRIAEAPNSTSSCCNGYALLSDHNGQAVTITLADSQSLFSSFHAVVMYTDPWYLANDVWGRVIAYKNNAIISNTVFGGHDWSQVFSRETAYATLSEPADRIDIVPRVNLGFVSFAYSISTVPEPTEQTLFLVGLGLIGLIRRKIQ